MVSDSEKEVEKSGGAAAHSEVAVPLPPHSDNSGPAPVAVKRRGRPLIAVLYAACGMIALGVLYIVIFLPSMPYLLNPLEDSLTRSVRYPPANTQLTKDWRYDLLTEQAIWSDEIARINTGMAEAKPYQNRRQYLLYLADSYYRDEPHFEQARSAYINASLEPRSTSPKSFDIRESELKRRIGYCGLRIGDFAHAERYLEDALKLARKDKAAKAADFSIADMVAAMDNLSEVYIRQGKLVEARKLIDERLADIALQDAIYSVEPHLLFNEGLYCERKGDDNRADKLLKKAIQQLRDEDASRGVLPYSDKDRDRNIARFCRQYATFLRKHERYAESQEYMRQALHIMDNSP